LVHGNVSNLYVHLAGVCSTTIFWRNYFW